MHTKWFCKLNTPDELPDHKGREHQELAFMEENPKSTWGQGISLKQLPMMLTLYAAVQERINILPTPPKKKNHTKLFKVQLHSTQGSALFLIEE